MKCLECDGEIKVPEDALEGEILTCPDCGASFELYREDDGSFAIRPIPVVGEDWGE